MNRFLSFLLFLISSVCVAAQCDSLDASIATVIDSKDKTNMQSLEKNLINCPDLKDSLALLKHKIGVRFYVEGDLAEAIHYTQEALAIRKTIFENSTFDIGESHHNLGVFYKAFNDLKNAETHFTQAAKVYESLDLSKMADSYWELAGVYFLKGEYDRSLQNLDYALVKAKSFAEESTLLSCYLEYGNVLREQKKYSAAIDSLMQAKKILDQYYLGWDHAVLYTNLASNYLLSGQYPDAIEYGNRAIKLWIEFEDPYQESNEWNNLGLAYTRMGAFKKAAESLTKGKAIADQHNLYLTISQSQNNFGELFLAQGQIEKAVQSFHDGVRTLVTDFDTPHYLENPSRKQVGRVSLKRKVINDLSDKAAALLMLYEEKQEEHILTVCREAYEICDYTIDLLLMEQSEQSSRLFWREKVIPVYEKAIRASMLANDPAQAFHFLEKGKAFLLLENLQRSDALTELPDTTQGQLSDLRKELLAAQQMFEDADESQKNKALEVLLNSQGELDDFRKMLSAHFANYSAITSTLQVISYEAFKSNPLHDEVTTLHYFYGNDHIYALVMSSADPAEIYNLGERSKIEQLIRTYLSYFEERPAIENEPQKFIEVAHQLYRKLIEPLNINKGDELLVFPDGALAYLPFEALVSKPAESLNTVDYLLQDHVIRFAYSASILDQQQSSFVGKKTLSAFAPFASKNENSKYTPLVYSNDELKEIQAKVKGDYYLNEDASLKRFREISDALGVIHLSTHAFSTRDSENPYIVFSDTTLYLSELYGMYLSVDLVVLSACQSNIGELAPGEGVLSLGRGFTHAGARSMISSLWNVNAKTTGDILAAFYEQLQSGTSKHKALCQSKRSYLENPNLSSFQRSPYYWAGLVYYGGDDTLVLKAPRPSWWYLGAIGMGLFIIVAWTIKLKK